MRGTIKFCRSIPSHEVFIKTICSILVWAANHSGQVSSCSLICWIPSRLLEPTTRPRRMTTVSLLILRSTGALANGSWGTEPTIGPSSANKGRQIWTRYHLRGGGFSKLFYLLYSTMPTKFLSVLSPYWPVHAGIVPMLLRTQTKLFSILLGGYLRYG